jgi:hypothetical protein
MALGVETEFRSDLWEQVKARIQRFGRIPTENNRRQAYVPQGALAVENPVGTAPSFIVENGNQTIVALPGVPREMEYLMQHAILPYLRQRFQLTAVIKTRTLHTAGVGESLIDDRIDDLERLSNPSVGLAAHSGQVDVRITVKADSEAQAKELILPVEAELRQRLGSWIYGVDEETLEQVALRQVELKGWTLAVVEAGLNGELVRRLAAAKGPFRGGEVLSERPATDELVSFTDSFRQLRQAEVGLGVAIYPAGEKQDVFLVLITPQGKQTLMRPYGGPVEYAPRWAFHHSLDLIRNL